jgi:hypothetical protein
MCANGSVGRGVWILVRGWISNVLIENAAGACAGMMGAEVAWSGTIALMRKLSPSSALTSVFEHVCGLYALEKRE